VIWLVRSTVQDEVVLPPSAAGREVGEAPTNSSPEELRRLRLAVEASGEVIFMTDSSGTITNVNPEFVRVYGYKADELVGQDSRQAVVRRVSRGLSRTDVERCVIGNVDRQARTGR
jgi:PAS domain S-box-containing protein